MNQYFNRYEYFLEDGEFKIVPGIEIPAKSKVQVLLPVEVIASGDSSLLAQLSNELKVLSNRAKYIQEILDDKLDMRRKTKEVVFEILKTRGYDHIEGDEEYRYLLKMPMDSVTEENVTKLLAERDCVGLINNCTYYIGQPSKHCPCHFL